MTQPLLLDTSSAAEYLGMKEREFEEHVSRGTFRIVKLPSAKGSGWYRRNLFYREDLDKWVKDNAKIEV